MHWVHRHKVYLYQVVVLIPWTNLHHWVTQMGVWVTRGVERPTWRQAGCKTPEVNKTTHPINKWCTWVVVIRIRWPLQSFPCLHHLSLGCRKVFRQHYLQIIRITMTWIMARCRPMVAIHSTTTIPYLNINKCKGLFITQNLNVVIIDTNWKSYLCIKNDQLDFNLSEIWRFYQQKGNISIQRVDVSPSKLLIILNALNLIPKPFHHRSYRTHCTVFYHISNVIVITNKMFNSQFFKYLNW